MEAIRFVEFETYEPITLPFSIDDTEYTIQFWLYFEFDLGDSVTETILENLQDEDNSFSFQRRDSKRLEYLVQSSVVTDSAISKYFTRTGEWMNIALSFKDLGEDHVDYDEFVTQSLLSVFNSNKDYGVDTEIVVQTPFDTSGGIPDINLGAHVEFDEFGAEVIGNPFLGYLRELRFWHWALSHEEAYFYTFMYFINKIILVGNLIHMIIFSIITQWMFFMILMNCL